MQASVQGLGFRGSGFAPTASLNPSFKLNHGLRPRDLELKNQNMRGYCGIDLEGSAAFS